MGNSGVKFCLPSRTDEHVGMGFSKTKRRTKEKKTTAESIDFFWRKQASSSMRNYMAQVSEPIDYMAQAGLACVRTNPSSRFPELVF